MIAFSGKDSGKIVFSGEATGIQRIKIPHERLQKTEQSDANLDPNN